MGFIWKIFEKVSVYVLVFTLVPVSRFAVGSGRGDGAANFAELDSDFSEPGKHVWTFDMIGVCMFTYKFLRGIWVSVSTSLLVRQLPACSKVAMISDERWPNHVVTWRAARWYYCSIPALRHPTNSDVNVDGVTLSFFHLPCYHMFSARMRFSKLVTSFRVHTKQRGRDDGSMALD